MLTGKPGRVLQTAAAMVMAAFMLAAAPAVAAGLAEGGQNVRTHKKPPRTKNTVHCRICAGARCTVVAVRGRCTKQAALNALERRLKQREGRQRALRPPVLDDRKYRDLPAEKRRRVPHHTPEWTDHNQSDPGTTILEAGRRDLSLVRVEPAPFFRPEIDDEVLTGFEQDDSR
jgi:hypothetical protein